jgi:hypothetical protein
MAVALKSDVPQPEPTQLRSNRQDVYPEVLPTQGSAALDLGQYQVDQPPTPAVVITPQVSPTLLNVLSNLQLVSSVLAGSTVVLALVSYGASVYIERQLSQATQRLSQLQRSEQQLLTANELLKSHLAQQAESPAVELTPPHPDQVIFLRPAAQRIQPGETPPKPPGIGLHPIRRPMGY